MAITYHFDLYPRDDPRDGTRLVRFTQLQSAEYRGEANGTGAGRISLRGSSVDAAYIDPAGLQYVRVVRDDGSTEAVVGGFFLDNGDYAALTSTGNELLTFGGAGTLSYLARSVMWSHTYISPIFTGQDPFDGTWRLSSQSTVYAGGSFLGAMLWRVIYEAQHFTPGSHRHADGVTVTDTHDDDRTENALPDLTLGFDQFDDSNGNDWSVASGEFNAQIGENVLGVIKRLMEAGLYVSMDPDTFELNAWENNEHRRDRTGGAWGSSVVRFQAPIGGDIATGNIKSDAKRGIQAFIKRSAILAGGQDVFGASSTGGSDIPWEGFYPSDAEDQTALEGIATVQLGARTDAGDTVRLRMKLADDPSNGRYLPFEHVQLDDLVTLHTGSGQWDWNEAEFPVAAITILLRQGGDWDALVDLGSTYTSMAERSFQVPATPPAGGIRLCTTAVAGAPVALFAGQCNDVGADYYVYQKSIADAGDMPCRATDGNDTTWTQLAAPVGASYTWIAADFLAPVTPTSWRLLQYAGLHGTGSDEMATGVVIESSDDWGGPASPDTGTWTVRDTAVVAGNDTGVISFSGGTHRYWRIRATAGGAGGWVVVSWDMFGSGGTAPGTDAYTGTSNQAARCDHNHDLESLLTTETDTTLVPHPDGSGGVEWGADSGGAPVDATYLVTTANGTLTNEVVVGATPGGELGGTWASPTVDSVHSGSAHLALGTTSSTAAPGDHTHAGGGAHILLADGRSTPFDFTDMLQADDGSDFLWSDS